MRSHEELEQIKAEAKRAADRDWLRARDLVTALLAGFGSVKPNKRKYAVGKCIIGGAILLVSGGINSDDPYTVSRHVEAPAICQGMASDFTHRFGGQAWCLMEISAIKGDKLK